MPLQQGPILKAKALRLQRAGQLDAAEIIYRDILKLNSNDPEALSLLATISYQRGHSEHAARLITKSLGIDPAQPRALVNRGLALVALRRYEQALVDADQAIIL